MGKYGAVKNRVGPIPATVDEKAHFKSGLEYTTSLHAEITRLRFKSVKSDDTFIYISLAE